MTARQITWPLFFLLVLAGWIALWIMAQEVRGEAVYGPGFWAAICRAGVADLAYLPLVAMWGVMTAAMMVPTFAPALSAYLALPPPAGRPDEVAGLVAGYLAVWLAAAFGFAALQLVLARSDLAGGDGRVLSEWSAAAILGVAGLYQFSRLKAACLHRCRTPLSVFLSRWRPGVGASFSIGVAMGRDCLGCCWALMLLAFVGGMGNLLFMGLATVLMVAEKLPQIGRPLTAPLGFALLGAAVAAGYTALGG